MEEISIREPKLSDEDEFLKAMKESETLHHPWTKAPTTPEEFHKYLKCCQQDNIKGYFACNSSGAIIGVFNFSEIVRGFFQNAYLGFYAVAKYAGKGNMSAGLKLVLKQAFTILDLHRIEANIQPQNISSINLVKSNRFRKEGFSPRYLKINNIWCDHERWAITVEDWC